MQDMCGRNGEIELKITFEENPIRKRLLGWQKLRRKDCKMIKQRSGVVLTISQTVRKDRNKQRDIC